MAVLTATTASALFCLLCADEHQWQICRACWLLDDYGAYLPLKAPLPSACAAGVHRVCWLGRRQRAAARAACRCRACAHGCGADRFQPPGDHPARWRHRAPVLLLLQRPRSRCAAPVRRSACTAGTVGLKTPAHPADQARAGRRAGRLEVGPGVCDQEPKAVRNPAPRLSRSPVSPSPAACPLPGGAECRPPLRTRARHTPAQWRARFWVGSGSTVASSIDETCLRKHSSLGIRPLSDSR